MARVINFFEFLMFELKVAIYNFWKVIAVGNATQTWQKIENLFDSNTKTNIFIFQGLTWNTLQKIQISFYISYNNLAHSIKKFLVLIQKQTFLHFFMFLPWNQKFWNKISGSFYKKIFFCNFSPSSNGNKLNYLFIIQTPEREIKTQFL